METVTDFIHLGSKITADGDCSHEIKTRLLLGRKAMTDLLLLSHFSRVRHCATPFLGFSRQEHWSGLPFPSPMHKSEKGKWSRSVKSNSSWPHGLQHIRPPCPSLTPEFTQNHVHWVGDAIQPSHPLSSSFSPAFNLSQHQCLFKWVSSSHQVAEVLALQL